MDGNKKVKFSLQQVVDPKGISTEGYRTQALIMPGKDVILQRYETGGLPDYNSLKSSRNVLPPFKSASRVTLNSSLLDLVSGVSTRARDNSLEYLQRGDAT
jgi:hypothetical protein